MRAPVLVFDGTPERAYFVPMRALLFLLSLTLGTAATIQSAEHLTQAQSTFEAAMATR